MMGSLPRKQPFTNPYMNKKQNDVPLHGREEDDILTRTPIKNLYSPGSKDKSDPSDKSNNVSPDYRTTETIKQENPRNPETGQDINEKLNALSKDWNTIK